MIVTCLDDSTIRPTSRRQARGFWCLQACLCLAIAGCGDTSGESETTAETTAATNSPTTDEPT
ncbi:MAG: hypothetical protein ACPG77_20855, partial [Nannocystaceae bacterium]